MTGLHVRLREWESIGPGTGIDCPPLCGFRLDARDRSLVDELSNAGVLEARERRDGLQISARAHVGRIQLGQLTVTIVPKLGARDLLALFRYVYRLRDLRLFAETRYAASGDLLQDVLIAQLLGEVRTILERGIARSYVERDDELSSPRGKIDFLRLAVGGTRNGTTLPCRHAPRETDNALNRCLLAGLIYAQGLVVEPRLRADVMRTVGAMQGLARDLPLSTELLRSAKHSLSRLVASYESVIGLIELLHRGCLLELEGAVGEHEIPGFLIDMNRFFQRLIERFLEKSLPDGLTMESEHHLSDMFRYVPDENPRHRGVPTPRPDYAIKRAGRVIALLDAKYRDLWNEALPRDMLYQLSVYALSQQRGSTAAILYPTADSAARPARIEIRDPARATTAGYVALRPVLLPRLVELVGVDGENAARARTELAFDLIGLSQAVRRERSLTVETYRSSLNLESVPCSASSDWRARPLHGIE